MIPDSIRDMLELRLSALKRDIQIWKTEEAEAEALVEHHREKIAQLEAVRDELAEFLG
ncbi:hypothetical protein [Mycolicibacterium sp. S2-37]|uniref:hypothetical protein n=1 Tax=Mycolicibacterium sp. S2-37 TaxID=2810297 RepID=UPI001A951793|nr:hypothetical protein [Mycolicibacterium sp. S2-37]